MTGAAWNPLDEAQDYIVLAGKRSPGIAEVYGASSPRLWDKRKGHGITGSHPVFTGRDLAEFTVRLRLYTVQDWNDWRAWKPLVDRVPTARGGKGPDTGCLDIGHPLLADLDIKSAVVVKVRQPEQSGDGEWAIEIDFMEFRKPKVTLAKPEASAATPVEDPVDREIKAKLDQVGKLAGIDVAKFFGKKP